MDLQSRKIEFIQEFLKLQSEEVIFRLESILKKEKGSIEKSTRTFSKEELNRRIEKSESDFENNRFKSTSQLLTKYSK